MRSRNLIPSKLEEEIKLLIDDICICLKNQYKFWKGNRGAISGEPNFKSLEEGFPKLNINRLDERHRWEVIYNDIFVGNIIYINEEIEIEDISTKELDIGKHVHHESSYAKLKRSYSF